MIKVIPALTARTQFGQIVRRARENGDRFIVDKNGEPQVVILSIEDYLANVLKQPKSLKSLQKAADKRGLSSMTERDIDAEVRRIRKELRRAT
ncbi:MAG: type II toxin-antitoxin system Phd/YefM family antitoxin [Acidobacteria bacterium]|nr:type II toxin-antitoxin system Phd/YefM family antitoxin [Acidobacteriota bacterium]MBI3656550.1 type II toxin-antitoxin system Phd/YefM family antitoxin [Acidobacteriota bacterium]